MTAHVTCRVPTVISPCHGLYIQIIQVVVPAADSMFEQKRFYERQGHVFVSEGSDLMQLSITTQSICEVVSWFVPFGSQENYQVANITTSSGSQDRGGFVYDLQVATNFCRTAPRRMCTYRLSLTLSGVSVAGTSWGWPSLPYPRKLSGPTGGLW